MAAPIERSIDMNTTVAGPMVPTMARVDRVRKETHDTFTLELRPAYGQDVHRFAAGQFNMLYVFGFGEVAISISGDPTNPKPLIHTTRAVGNVTKAMARLKTGDMIGVRGPFGTAWPVEHAQGNDVVIIAGGIGLAPLRPVIYQILADRRKYGKFILLYGTRTPSDILYRKELESWRSRLDMEVHVTVDRASTNWQGNVGVVTTLIPKAGFDPQHTTAMVCGPEIMMRYVALELQKRGVPMGSVHASMERNMKCGIGLCGHCQMGSTFICKDGPVYPYDKIRELLQKREV